MKKLVLASQSPRRKQLLDNLGVSFTIIPSLATETRPSTSNPERLVESLAKFKAETVGRTLSVAANSLVIGADTIVVLDGSVLGKPEDEHEAAAMLRRLSGRWHQVFTGVAIFDPQTGGMAVSNEVTAVKIKPLSSEEISAYVATKEPFDKAGAYGIQDKGALLVERIQGCYFNVVGLPLVKLAALLARWGVDLLKYGEEVQE
ncbi:MAG TPA: Maf family protein [bacterium]|nr:Maf family protein [bacterium]